MKLPIIQLKNIVSGLLDYVRTDLQDNIEGNTEENSWLYENFFDTVLDDHNFYQQLKNLLLLGQEDSRKLEVRTMFDKERANLPTFHIHFPDEDGSAVGNFLNTSYDIVSIVNEETIDRKNVYSRSFSGNYDIIITAGNSIEVVMLYEFLDALLIAAADTLAYNFDTFSFRGKQLSSDSDIIPFLIFYRAISLQLINEKTVTSLLKLSSAEDIKFNPILYTNERD